MIFSEKFDGEDDEDRDVAQHTPAHDPLPPIPARRRRSSVNVAAAAAAAEAAEQESVLVLNSGTVPMNAIPEIIKNTDVHLALEAIVDAGTMGPEVTRSGAEGGAAGLTGSARGGSLRRLVPSALLGAYTCWKHGRRWRLPETVVNRDVVAIDVDETALAKTKRMVLDALAEAGFNIAEVNDGKSIEERLRAKVINGYETAFYIMDIDVVLRKHKQWLELLKRVQIRYGALRHTAQ